MIGRAEFDRAFARAVGDEGWPAVTNHACDRGGLTKFATLRDFNLWRQSKGEAMLTAEQFAELGLEDVRPFVYEEHYQPLAWVDAPGAFGVLAEVAVMSGPAAAVRCVQQVIKGGGWYLGKIDGIAGPKTRAAWAAARRERRDAALIAGLAEARWLGLAAIALGEAPVLELLASFPQAQLHNLRGWGRRLVRTATLAAAYEAAAAAERTEGSS